MKLNIDVPDEVGIDNLRGFCRMQQLELWLREMLYLELKAAYGLDWWSVAESAMKRAKKGGIPAGKSLRADRKHPHMATPENDPLWFVSFDSLLTILYDRRVWSICRAYFTTKALLRGRFEELRPIRNRIAHARRLLSDDVIRIERFLHDFNKGFWQFCTSYNMAYGFIETLRKDPIYRHFSDREHIGFAKVGMKGWARVGTRVGVDVDLSLDFLVRPSGTRKIVNRVPKRGGIYDVSFTVGHTDWFLDYDRILRETRRSHINLLHVILDSFAASIRVTIPASVSDAVVISTLEEFYQATLRNRTIFPRRHPFGTGSRNRNEGNEERREDFLAKQTAEYANRMREFDVFVADWPHYVVSPGHPFAFLGPDAWPCSFFGV